MLGELGVAALLGLSLAMLNELASLAGQLLGMQFSFSLVNLLDPNSEVQTPLLAQMLRLLEITVLLAAGLHRTILAALLHTFAVVPLGSGSGSAGDRASAGRHDGRRLPRGTAACRAGDIRNSARRDRHRADVSRFAATAGSCAHSAGEDSSRIRGAASDRWRCGRHSSKRASTAC